MLLPDPENDPEYVRVELAALRAELGVDPTIEELRAARQRLSPRVREYLRAQAIRAMVVEEALLMVASGEMADVRFDDAEEADLPERQEEQLQD